MRFVCVPRPVGRIADVIILSGKRRKRTGAATRIGKIAARGNGLKMNIEGVGTQQEIASVMMAGEADPLEWPSGERRLLREVTIFRNAQSHRVFEPLAENGVSFVEISARIVNFIGGGADGLAVNLNSCAGGHAGDRQHIGVRRNREHG